MFQGVYFLFYYQLLYFMASSLRRTLVLSVLWASTHPGRLKNYISSIRPAQAGKILKV
jgi:hypothetical protein